MFRFNDNVWLCILVHFISFRLGVRNFVSLRRRLLPLLVGPRDVAGGGGVFGPPDIVVALAHVCLHEAVEIHILNQPVARHIRTVHTWIKTGSEGIYPPPPA
jgi:hypothetical protein